jgi:hypothetical protein
VGKGKGGPRRNGYFLLELGGRIVSRKMVKRAQAFLLLLRSVYHCNGIFPFHSLWRSYSSILEPVYKELVFFLYICYRL